MPYDPTLDPALYANIPSVNASALQDYRQQNGMGTPPIDIQRAGMGLPIDAMVPAQRQSNDYLEQVLTQQQQDKQSTQNNGGLIQQILSNRMQPAMQDISTSINNTASSFGAPDQFKAESPDQAMANRFQAQLSPYTQALGLQKAQMENKYYAPEMESKIALNKAQALMASGGGLFGAGGTVSPTGGQVQVTGDDFLKTLNPAIGNMVKAISEGRQPMPQGFILKTPFGQQLMAAIHAYDPQFDFVNANSRMGTRKSFTSGQDAGNIAALNTAIAHLGTLSDSFGKLGNSAVPSWNSATNAIGNAIGNSNIQTNTANVGADAEAVSHELAKVFRSTGMSEGEINAWKEKINTNASPAQMNATINSALDLMEGRMQALSEKYNQGMGTTKQPLELLSPQAQKSYNKLRGFGSPNAQSTTSDPLSMARDAISKGADKNAVMKRLQDNGIDASGL